MNTPAKFADLKAGVYNGKYRHVVVTNRAIDDVLLQPQHFVNAPFESLNFESTDDFGVSNRIEIFPGQPAYVRVIFVYGKNPLDGAPNHFALYELFVSYPAAVSAANIDSILQWKSAREIRIYESLCGVAVSLMGRLGQLGELKHLEVLTLSLAERLSKQINVLGFIDNLESLLDLTFISYDLTDEQMKAFVAEHPAPANWWAGIVGNHIRYMKQ